jgi:predicted RND superfamily exporter protein
MSITKDSANGSNTRLSVNEASNVFNKSIATIRKLIELEKIPYIKENNRVFILYSELEKIYGDPSITNSTNGSNTQENVSTNSSTNGSNTQSEFYEKLISSKDDQMAILSRELLQKNEEINRLHKLLENQQILSLETTRRLPNVNEKPRGFLGWFKR